jgi:hypothetical protein
VSSELATESLFSQIAVIYDSAGRSAKALS